MCTDSLFGEMLRLALFGTVLWPPASRFEAQPLLTRLVKAEIMSPYCGILIDTGVGNPTMLFTQPLGIGEF